jgi:ATP-dependent DNA helicase RecQ
VVQQRRMIDGSEGDFAHRRRLQSHLDAMLALCEATDCRRAQLLGYFSERAASCGNCDTCLAPPEVWDGTVPAQKLLSTIVRLSREYDQRYGAGQVIDILLGRATEKVKEKGHDALKTFGIGTELKEAEWRAIVRQLLAKGLLAVQGDYQTLGLTDASTEVLRGQREVMLRKEAPAPRAARASTRGTGAGGAAGAGSTALAGSKGKLEVSDLSPADEVVYEKLAAWRKAIAAEQNIPAYTVFHNSTLKSIAVARPSSLRELAGISGVGEAKLAKYGQPILDLLAEA